MDTGPTQFFQGINRAKYDLSDRMSRYAIVRDRELAEYKNRLVSSSDCCGAKKKANGTAMKGCGCAVRQAVGAPTGAPTVKETDTDGFGAFRAPISHDAWAKGAFFAQ
jgi:hypothetical protein